MTGADPEEVAVLLRISEPAHPPLVRHVRRVGVAQTIADVRANAPIPDVDVEGMRLRLATASGAADLEAAARVGARLVVPGSPEWPARLDELAWIDRDCFGVYVRGSLPLAEAVTQAVAIVGTRAATDYGVHVAGDMACALAERGWTVVSGLAYGIDAAAHRGALAVGGLTVAAVACGIDTVYPKGHASLQDRVAASGAVLSEHPPGSAPLRHRFLVRNRLIAALSAGTVVVEMSVRSGARSTANHAAALNRHVMCVPGPVTSATSSGCHRLLRDRPDAVLVTDAAEVVEQCGAMGDLADPEPTPAQARDLLGPTVARVLEAVPVTRAAPVASIARVAGIGPSVVRASLAALVEVGLVRETPSGWTVSKAGRAERRERRELEQLRLELG